MCSTLVFIDRPNHTAVQLYTSSSEVEYVKRLKRVRNMYIVSYSYKGLQRLESFTMYSYLRAC